MQFDPKSSPAPRRFGKYLLLERIGRGGMAEVYRSKTFGAAGFVKECAIKKILASLLDDEQFVRMFVDEAKLTAHLTHPNIVQVLDLGEIDGHLFIAMEYVPGKDLLDVLARSARRGLRIPLEITLYVATELLKGLDYAHSAANAQGRKMHIVHRDVSPSNVLLSYDGQVKVGDFGIAKSQMQSSRTEVGTQKGKTGYMSPEQVTGHDIDRRSDLFAAAVILFEMLTMTRLFKAANDLEVMLKIRDADIEEDIERVAHMAPALEQIIRRGLRKRPEDRYQTAAEFLDALRDVAVEHRFKLSAAPLATYLQDLFSDKIESERVQRAEDPVDDAGFAAVASANEAVYRYRDREGVIHGPMKLALLEELLASRVPNDAEAIAAGVGEWRPVDAYPEFGSLLRPGPAAALDESGPAQRPTGTDWEDLSLAGINPRARRRLRQVATPSSESGVTVRVESGGIGGRDPGKATTREIVAVDTGGRVRPGSPSAGNTARGVAPQVSRTGRERPDAETPTGVSVSVPRAGSTHPTGDVRALREHGPAEIDPRTLRDAMPGPAPRPLDESAAHRSSERRATASGGARAIDPRSASASQRAVEIVSGAQRPPDLRSADLRPTGPAPSGPDPLSVSGAQRAVFGAPPSGATRSGATASAVDSGVAHPVTATGALNRPPRITANHPVAVPAHSPEEAEALRRAAVTQLGPPDRAGDIGATSVFRVLHRLHQAQATGLLQVAQGGVAKEIYFDAGEVLAVDSDSEHDDLLAILRRAGVISAAQAESAAGRARETGVGIGEGLVAVGALQPHMLFHYLREQIQEALLSSLFWEDGVWRWWTGHVATPDPLAAQIRVGEVLARAVAERAESRYFRRFYRALRTSPMVQKLGGPDLAPLALSARAMRLAAAARESGTIAELIRTFCDRYNWPEGEVYRTLFLLTEQEVFRFEGESDDRLP